MYITAHEALKAVHGLFKLCGRWQKNHSEMVGLGPVKACALYQQHAFPFEEIQGKLNVVCDVEAFDVNLRETVQRAVRLDTADTRDLVEPLVNLSLIHI